MSSPCLQRAKSQLYCGLLLAVISPVLLATPSHAAEAQQAARQATGTDMFAVVTTDGQVARGTPGVTVTHTADSGLYDVHFPQSVATCAANANLGYPSDQEEFTFQSAVTVGRTSDPNTIAVDVTFPGMVSHGGAPPRHPSLADNAFHLHLQCGSSGEHAVVAAGGRLVSGSPGVTAARQGEGTYTVTFPGDLSKCAAVATVRNRHDRGPRALQAYLSLDASKQAIHVSTDKGTGKVHDAGFELTITCTGAYALFADSNGFYNKFKVNGAPNCAFTGSIYNAEPGSQPSDQGYVATWYTNATTAGIQTKNGGYGIEPGLPVDVVATC